MQVSKQRDASAESGPVRYTWPLVGREDTLARIAGAAGQPAISGVVLVGAPGVGRSRLTREACARLARDGREVARATSTRAAADIAFGALPHLIPRVPDRPGGAFDVFQQFIERFDGTRQDRLVLAIDDAHLLDNASAALLHHLAVQRRIFLILTMRARAQVPDALRALWKERLALRIEVPALSATDIDTLLDRASGRLLDTISRARLADLCAGNLVMLRELVGAGLETGTLRVVDGLQHWAGNGEYGTDRLADLVDSYWDESGSGFHEILELLACARTLDRFLVERLAGKTALAEAERRQLVVSELAGDCLMVRLVTPAHGEVARSRMSAACRRAIFRQLAEALAASGPQHDDDMLVLTWWRLQGGLPVTPADLLAGARHALAGMDTVIAEQFAVAARDRFRSARADLMLAEVLAAQGRHRQAASVLVDAADRWGKESLARFPVPWEWVSRWASEDSGFSVQPGALAAPCTGRAIVVEMLLVWHRLLDGQLASVLEQGRLALRIRALRSVTVARAIAAATVAVGILGQADQVEHFARAGVDTCVKGLPSGATLMDGAQCAATLLSGSPELAAELAVKGYRAAVGARAEQAIAGWSGLRGMVARVQGRVGTALTALREAAVLLQHGDALRLGRIFFAELAGAYGMAGDASEAQRWWVRAQQYEPASRALVDAWMEINHAWVAAADLDLPRAAGYAIKAGAVARAGRLPMVEALALLDAARLGAAEQVAGRLTDLARATPSAKVVVFAQFTGALAAKDARRLEAAAQDLRQLGYLLPAAEAAMAAYRYYAAAGRRSSGFAAFGMAREMLTDCGEARTPLLDLTGVHNELTVRELQVARLAADGLPAQTIADRLGLSCRTVNNHLSHVYAKLGLAGRRDLADLLSVPVQAG